MFDVFYIGQKPNLFVHEQQASSINDARSLSRTRYLWVVNAHNDYSSFDWHWEPVPWESNQIHIWPSQHQENGGTLLVPKHPVTDTNRSHKQIKRVKSAPIIGIDHGNGLNIECAVKTRYISDYLGTLKRVLSKVSDEYVWVVSSVCNYDNFDFTWHPSEWQQDMLHVFASNDQKFGDTFYVHVPSFLKKVEKLALLEWFDTIHFVEGISVPRRDIPVVRHNHDSVVDAIWEHDFQTPVVQFVKFTEATEFPTVNLWRPETKAVIPLSKSSATVIVPREAKNHIKTQVYDYPNIDKNYNQKIKDPALDIVFLSNGEALADKHWELLKEATHKWPNRVVRVDGVNGRVKSQHAAADAVLTDYYFLFPSKIEVNPGFNWAWQPDMLQQPKHYIFYALNPITKLEYGHMAMVAYNKKLVKATTGQGLDFTLDQAHEVVPVRSGTVNFGNDYWTVWRTAFRECIKLKNSTGADSEYRLNKWLTSDDGTPVSAWSRAGAKDAVDYFTSVNGVYDLLYKTYEWSWLENYFTSKYCPVAEIANMKID